MATIRQRVGAAYRAFKEPGAMATDLTRDAGPTRSVRVPEETRERCLLFDLYVEANAYRDLRRLLIHVPVPPDYASLRFLENPAAQAVEFHVIHVFPGALAEALPLDLPEDDPLAEATARVLGWSNFGAAKDILVGEQALYGESWLRASVDEDSARISVRHPEEITKWKEDDRRNVVYLRLDVEVPDAEEDERWHTEIWDKEEGTYRSWRSAQGWRFGEDLLGTPREDLLLTDMGIDFVPFVRAPFGRVRPNVRAAGVFEHALEPIDQNNRDATGLRDVWRDNAEGVWAMRRNEAGMGPVNDPRPDPIEDGAEPEEQDAHGKRLVRLPGLTSLESLIPNVDYPSGLAILADGRRALETTLAELRYFRGREGGDPSAAAIRQDQAPAIARAKAARGNAEDALSRALKMCLTMGRSRGLFDADPGDYERGDYDRLVFREREIVPESPQERAEREQSEAGIIATYANAGLLAWYLEKERGYSPEDARDVAAQATAATRSPGGRVADLIRQQG